MHRYLFTALCLLMLAVVSGFTQAADAPAAHEQALVVDHSPTGLIPAEMQGVAPVGVAEDAFTQTLLTEADATTVTMAPLTEQEDQYPVVTAVGGGVLTHCTRAADSGEAYINDDALKPSDLQRPAPGMSTIQPVLRC